MEYNKKALKIAAKITAATFSESGKLGAKNAEKAAEFLKELCAGIEPVAENCVKDAFKAAGKITAAAFEEAEEPKAETAAEFFRTVYEGIVPAAEKEDFDEDVFEYAGKIAAAACEEAEEPDEEMAKAAAEFVVTLYASLTEEKVECAEKDSEEEKCTEDDPAAETECSGKYSVKETASGFSFRLVAGNNQVIGVSEVYSSRAAMEKGIESVRNNAPKAAEEDLTEENSEKVTNPKFEIYKDKAEEFRFRLKAKNGEVILASEGYKTKAACEKGIASVRKNAPAEIRE